MAWGFPPLGDIFPFSVNLIKTVPHVLDGAKGLPAR